MNTKKKDTLFMVMLIALALLSMAVCVLMLIKKGAAGEDFTTYWQNFAFTIRGYDLNQCRAAGISPEGFDKLGIISVMPYARLFGNLIVPGYLSEGAAMVYYYIIFALTLILLGKNIREYVKENNLLSGPGTLAAVVLICFPWYWGDTISSGNIGSLLGIFGILSAFYVKKNPNFCALLLFFSLIKPQIGVPFCILLLLMKEYGIFLKVCGLAAVGWIADYVYVAALSRIKGLPVSGFLTTFTDAVAEFSSSNTSVGTDDWWRYYGIFDILSEVGVPNIIILLLSATAGIIFLIVFYRMIKKSKYANDTVMIYSVAALASIFWFYKSQGDSVVIILCSLMILHYRKNNEGNIINLINCGLYLVALNCIVFRYFFRMVIPILTYKQGVFLDMLIQIVFFSILLIILCSKKEKPNEEDISIKEEIKENI